MWLKPIAVTKTIKHQCDSYYCLLSKGDDTHVQRHCIFTSFPGTFRITPQTPVFSKQPVCGVFQCHLFTVSAQLFTSHWPHLIKILKQGPVFNFFNVSKKELVTIMNMPFLHFTFSNNLHECNCLFLCLWLLPRRRRGQCQLFILISPGTVLSL